MKNENIIRVALVTIGILLIPFILQITIGTGVDGQGFNWKLGDFIVMGFLIFMMGLVILFVAEKFKKPYHRLIAIFIVILIFLLIWAELAVGIFGTPFAGS